MTLTSKSSALAVALLAFALPLAADAHCDRHDAEAKLMSAVAADDAAIMAAPDDLQWTPGPGSLPKGVEFVLIEGDPRGQ